MQCLVSIKFFANATAHMQIAAEEHWLYVYKRVCHTVEIFI
jgi:hypothetical protein